MSLPLIGYDNILRTATVACTTEETDYESDFLYDGLLYTWFRPNGVGTHYVTIDAGGVVPVDYIGIFGHDLTEKSATVKLQEGTKNEVIYSEDFQHDTGWIKVAATVDNNVIESPTSTISADKIVENTATTTHYAYKNFTYEAKQYTFSCYAKKGERKNLRFVCYDGVTYFLATFDLNLGISGAHGGGAISSISDEGDGWYRCSIIFTAVAGAGQYQLRILDDIGTNTYAGDGISGLYLWGAQLEEGALSAYVPSTETFTSRATTGTYYDATGTLQTAAIDTARYTYNPSDLAAPASLLLEDASTNELTYSEQFDNAAWSKQLGITVTVDSTTAPDGNTTADTLIPANGVDSYIADASGYTSTSGTHITCSLFVKKGSVLDEIVLLTPSAWMSDAIISSIVLTFSTESVVISDNGSHVTDYSLQILQDGWYKISITVLPTASALGSIQIRNSDDTANGTTDSIIVWGAQLEESSFPSSYIPTTTTAVTRAADISSSAATTSYTDLTTTLAKSDSEVIFDKFTQVNKRYYRLVVVSGATVPSISCVWVGEAMELQRGLPSGFIPPHLSLDNKYVNSKSDTGLLLGRSITSKYNKGSIKVNSVTPAWVRSDWQPFILYAETMPFFFSWNEADYPDEAVFCISSTKIKAPKYKDAMFMDISLDFEAWWKL